MSKIGLYFGSFNPIHVGHMVIASSMVEHTDMEEVWFVVSPQNPFKVDQLLLEDCERVEMVRLATAGDERLKVCDIELGLPKPSYTYVTLQALRSRFPDKEFCLIMGSDNLDHFDRWRNYEEIVEEYPVYVFPRPEHPIGRWAGHKAIHWVECPQMEISSSYIREEIAQGHSIRHLVPEMVFPYLSGKGFYKR